MAIDAQAEAVLAELGIPKPEGFDTLDAFLEQRIGGDRPMQMMMTLLAICANLDEHLVNALRHLVTYAMASGLRLGALGEIPPEVAELFRKEMEGEQ